MAEKIYYLVNPAGAIHTVSREHATLRLQSDARYRIATPEEVEVFKEIKVQRADRPIARPWSPDPDLGAPDVGAGEVTAQPDATDSAQELAEEHGIDLRTIQGTGADGRILKRDVEGAIEKG